MSKLKQLLENKPSKAVIMMVTGLRNVNNNSSLRIDMSTFGSQSHGVCYGCAATTVLMELTGVSFTVENIGRRSRRLGALGIRENLENWTDLESFENAIDGLRRGLVYHFLRYFLDVETTNELIDAMGADCIKLQCLENDYTEEQLAEFEKLASWLEDKGY